MSFCRKAIIVKAGIEIILGTYTFEAKNTARKRITFLCGVIWNISQDNTS
jgi:hypothetical protein